MSNVFLGLVARGSEARMHAEMCEWLNAREGGDWHWHPAPREYRDSESNRWCRGCE